MATLTLQTTALLFHAMAIGALRAAAAQNSMATVFALAPRNPPTTVRLEVTEPGPVLAPVTTDDVFALLAGEV